MTRPLFLDRLLVSLLRRMLRSVVRYRVVPEEPAGLGVDRSRPVCYALHVRQLSAFLVLDEAARQLGLPLPSAPLAAEGLSERSAFFFLTRSGQPSPLRRNPYRYSPRLQRLVAAVRSEPALDVQVVPVSVFWGRAPSRDDSVVSLLFADTWAAPGSVRQFFRVLVHGRRTLVRFGEPFSLRETIADMPAPREGERDPATRRVGRLLRGTFRRDRELAVGPNLSHRQTLLNSVIESEPVQRAIAEEATRRGMPAARAELQARRFAYEIASDYSYAYIRLYEKLLDAFWRRIYDGIEVHRFDEIAQAGGGAEIVYLPCHRSHVDYLVLSYVLHQRGLSPPHIAAGVNLNLPLVGALLRRGGAFFLRRSFRGEPLFAAVFREYLHAIVQRGHPIEFFVEGGRSRSGRMLPPKAGILAMTVESFLRDPGRPVVFMPIWIGYEQLMEGESYVRELAGEAKRRETLGGLLRALRDLRSRRFGRVHLNVGEPIRLDAALDARWPGWREELHGDARDGPHGAPASEGDGRPPVQPGLGTREQRERFVASLARTIVVRINEALVANPVTLLATAIAGAPRLAMDRAHLAQRIDLLRTLLLAQPLSDRQVVTPLEGEAVIEQAIRDGLVRRVADPFGDLVVVAPERARLLGYFANNVLHAFSLPSLLACLLTRRPGVDRAGVGRATAAMHPFLSAELCVGWSEQELEGRTDALLVELERRGLARRADGGWHPPPPGRGEAATLEALARIVRPSLERHLLVIKVLAHAGPDVLGVAQLQARCAQLARRLSLIQGDAGADFADPASFSAIVETVVAIGIAVPSEDGRLRFGERFEEAVREADNLLPDELAQSIAGAARLAPGP